MSCDLLWDPYREYKLSKRDNYLSVFISNYIGSRSFQILANTPNQAETLLHSLERAAAGIGLHVNANKTEYMCYNQTGNIATLDRASLKLVDKFTYLGSSVSSTEKDIDTRLTKAWTAIDRLSIIWKSDLTDKMKRSFFQAAVVSILLYGCTTWTLTKRLERRLDGNYTRMLRAVLNKSWRQHPTRLQLYGHLPPITKTIQVRRTRHAGHCWRSKEELISDVLLWTPTYECARVGRPARTYIQQLCEDTGCNPEDLPEAMNDREKWRERVRDIRAGGATWWWWHRICGPYNIRTTFKSLTTLRRYLSRVRPPTEENMTKDCVYAIPCNCGRKYKGEIGRPLKVRLQEHQKSVTRGEVGKSGVADHIWRERGDRRSLWDQVEIIDKEHHWKIRKLKESTHMLGLKISWAD